MDDHDHRWLLLRSQSAEPAFNMALDEALLEAVGGLGRPVLRFYSWSQPAASFGYFQKYAEVERMTLLRPLVRRPTAGGLVPHDADWTYSLMFPPQHHWYSLRATESYRLVHLWVQAAFAKLKVATELAPCCRKAEPGQCFAGYEMADVLWNGRKIAGAAQRRNRNGLLIQGSVQPPPLGMNREVWEKAMCEVARTEGRSLNKALAHASWEELELHTPLTQRAVELAAKKYSRLEFNQKR